MRLVSSKEFDVRAADPDRDFDVFYDLLCILRRERDSYVMVNYMGEVPPREELKERSKVWNKSRSHLEVAFCNHLLVGYAGAVVGPNFGTAQPHEAEIYYAVRREYRGAGLSYALLLSLLNRLSVKYIHAYVYVGNTPSIRTLEALGLNRLTLLEEYIYHTGEGRYHDLYLYRGLRLEAVKKARERLVHRGYKIVEV
jgi:ribosomal-protein-alanine N-acetyltransferase